MCQVSYWESKVKNNRMIICLSVTHAPVVCGLNSLFYPLHIIIAFSEAWKELPGLTLSFQEFQKNVFKPFRCGLFSVTNVIDYFVRSFKGII